jgi:CelD/BcsL family acetyltransferase involved in cellulose biosynthesis
MSSMERIAVRADRREVARVHLGAVPGAGEPRVLVRPLAAAIDDLAAEWTALADIASEPNAFAEHWFVAASLPTMAVGSDIRLMEVRRGPRLIGLLPVEAHRGYARLPVRIARNWAHDQMFLMTPLVAAGEETAFWTAILAALDDAGWAGALLHLRGLNEDGPVLRGLAAARPASIAYREVRALLQSDLDPEAYYERAVRQKKRKELRRLRNRLAEQGPVTLHSLDNSAQVNDWCTLYLAMEQAGWKGAAGSALAGRPETEAFFRAAVRAAWDAGKLQFLRLDVGGTTIAMLVNFLSPPGSFSFKTVFDEAYARFSPGVLIQRENLEILRDPRIAWMDSCAAADHPMIDSLWTERRAIVRVSVPLKGARRAATFAVCRALERGSAMFRKLIK